MFECPGSLLKLLYITTINVIKGRTCSREAPSVTVIVLFSTKAHTFPLSLSIKTNAFWNIHKSVFIESVESAISKDFNEVYWGASRN